MELDFTNMMEDVLGENGTSKRDVEDIRDIIGKAHISIMKRVYKGLDFLDLIGQDLSGIRDIAGQIRHNSEYLLILGIGGSALGPRAILNALMPFHNLKNQPKVFIYDNVDPDTINHILSIIDIKKTTVNVITKSGSTAETMASFLIMRDRMRQAHGKDYAKRIVATTDPKAGYLREMAEKEGFPSLDIPEGVSGRSSVLSPVGLLLSEAVGIDSDEMLRGAGEIVKRCSSDNIWENPAYVMGSLSYIMERKRGRGVSVLVPYSDRLKAFGQWYCQLWAESLGKSGLGQTPYPSHGVTDQHSQMQLWIDGPQDKVITFIRINNHGPDIRISGVDTNGLGYLEGHSLGELIMAEQEATEMALTKAKRPNMRLTIETLDAFNLGSLFMFFQIVTAFTGMLYGINPFDQPGVEEGKRLTYGIMGRKGFENEKAEVDGYRNTMGRYRC